MDIQLSKMETGKTGRITKINGSEMEVALLNMGIVVGDTCLLSDIAPLGDPIAITINGTKISMRKRDAENVWVIANENI